jgi:hypothetical protein
MLAASSEGRSSLICIFACICVVCTLRKGLYIAYVQYVLRNMLYLGYIRLIIRRCFAIMNPNERGGGMLYVPFLNTTINVDVIQLKLRSSSASIIVLTQGNRLPDSNDAESRLSITNISMNSKTESANVLTDL